MSVLKFLSLVLICFSFQQCCYSKSNTFDVCSAWSENWRNSAELNSLVYTNVKPMGGANAGKYSKIKVNSWEACVTQ
ncbi:unnamed protein product, partial [Adineta steineri]